MDQITNAVSDIYSWAKKDFKEWPLRFILEIFAWFLSIGCAVAMAATIPNPPFLILYPVFIAQCGIFGWAAWSRGSVGMVSNYVLLVTIDVIGYIRLISN
jgi:hypothetical protein